MLTYFCVLCPVRGRLARHLRRGLKKYGKIEFVVDIATCLVMFFACFSKPLSFHLFAPVGTHMIKFRNLLATKVSTDWQNLQKWKHWFRAGEHMKVQLFRTCTCAAFVTLSYTCCKPVFFCGSRHVFTTFFQIRIPFCTPWWTGCYNNFVLTFLMAASCNYWIKTEIRSRHVWHILKKGRTRTMRRNLGPSAMAFQYVKLCDC